MAYQTVLNSSGINATKMNESTIQVTDASAPVLDKPFLCEKGSLLLDKYNVEKQIGEVDKNGEADLFLCTFDKRKFVLKVYRREIEGDREIVERLNNIRSASVAKIHETGRTSGRYVEVYEYFHRGSLADALKERTFTEEELRSFIIPQLNEALHALHTHDIFHRDIKPGNIVFSNRSSKKLVLIDFGFSYVTQNQKSVRVSRQAFTPGYAAPEAVNSPAYFDLSDYYSLGITLYELYMGKLPFEDSNESFSYLLAKPGKMSDELYQLIRGLTFIDIQNRHDPLNPNCRWGYEKVKQWLDGEELVTPGEFNTASEIDTARSIVSYSFCGNKYTDIDALVIAMCTNWEEGKKDIFRNKLTDHLRNRRNATDNQLKWASIIDDVIEHHQGSEDAKMAKILYSLSEEIADCFYCPIGPMKTLKEYGNALLNRLKSPSEIMVNAAIHSVELLVETDMLLQIAAKEKTDSRVINVVNEIKEMKQQNNKSLHRKSYCWYLAYILSGSTELDLDLPEKKVFRSITDLQKYLLSKGSGDYSDLCKSCGLFINSTYTLKPMVYGWMKAQGLDVSKFNK